MTTKVIKVADAACYMRAADCHKVTPMDFFHWGRKGLFEIEKYRNNWHVDFLDIIVVRTISFLRFFNTYTKDSEIIGLHNAWKKILSSKYKIDTEHPLAHKNAMTLGADIDLTFDESGMAVSWELSRGIEIHPGYLSGSPRIMGRRIHAKQVVGMYENGTSIKDLMWLMKINQREIEDAFRWERKLSDARI